MKNSAKMIVAAGESSADMRYATGFSTPDNYLFFELDGQKKMVLSPLEIDRARTMAHQNVEILSSKDFGMGIYEEILGVAKAYNIDTFLVPKDFPLLLADKLRGQNIVIKPCEEEFFPEREFKTIHEYAEIKRALNAAECAVLEACKVISEAKVDAQNRLVWNGDFLTSERLRSVIDLYIVSQNGQPTGTITASGVQGAEPHNGGSGIIYAFTPIVMDVFPRLMDSGYWGDLTRTVSKGRPAEVVIKAYKAVREARDTSRQAIAPEVNPANVHKLANDILLKHGFETGVDDKGRNYGFFHGLGHGVGLEIHEYPRLSPRNEKLLKGGEVITVEPGLYYPEWGGIRLEDMVFVTEKGNELMTSLESELIIE